MNTMSTMNTVSAGFFTSARYAKRGRPLKRGRRASRNQKYLFRGGSTAKPHGGGSPKSTRSPGAAGVRQLKRCRRQLLGAERGPRKMPRQPAKRGRPLKRGRRASRNQKYLSRGREYGEAARRGFPQKYPKPRRSRGEAAQTLPKATFGGGAGSPENAPTAREAGEAPQTGPTGI